MQARRSQPANSIGTFAQLGRFALLCLLGLGACAPVGDGGAFDPDAAPPADAEVVEEIAFTDLELAVIRGQLAPLPATPQAAPTNAYADDAQAAILGQKFYFESRYSANGEVSCATCHIPDAGFQDDRNNTSLGLGFTGRHAPTVINAAYGNGSETVWQFWDGRKDSLWSQALGPPENGVEMGGTRTGIALLIYDKYRDEYEAIFGAMPSLREEGGAAVAPSTAMPGNAEWNELDAQVQFDITSVYVNFGKAIAAYERKIISRNSRFDDFLVDMATSDDSPYLTEQEKLGLKVYVGKGRCITCHRGPNLTDNDFYNIGVPQVGEHLPSSDEGREGGRPAVMGDEFNCASPWSDHPNKSSCAVSINSLAAETGTIGAFKTPGLRDVTKTAPYMHTGELATLREVMEHYNRGGAGSGFVGETAKDVLALELSDDELDGLVALMRSFEGEDLPSYLKVAPQLPE